MRCELCGWCKRVDALGCTHAGAHGVAHTGRVQGSCRLACGVVHGGWAQWPGARVGVGDVSWGTWIGVCRVAHTGWHHTQGGHREQAHVGWRVRTHTRWGARCRARELGAVARRTGRRGGSCTLDGVCGLVRAWWHTRGAHTGRGAQDGACGLGVSSGSTCLFQRRSAWYKRGGSYLWVWYASTSVTSR
jgi:hypothetical protein